MEEFPLNQSVDLWVVPAPESNPWTPLIDWRLGFWHSRAMLGSRQSLKWDPVKPLLMATPAGLASPRILFWPENLESQFDFDRLVHVVAKLKTKSALFLVGQGKSVEKIESWMHLVQIPELDLKVHTL